MSDAIKTFQHAGCTVEIHQDEDAENPREAFDNVGKMVCFHKRHALGDKTDFKSGDYSGWDGLRKAIEEREQVAVILPLYLYDHSGITISTKPFSCQWDSGQVGFIYATVAQVKDEWDGDVDAATKYLQGEVETYDLYLRGDVYGFVVRVPNGEEESCWGFFGAECCEEEAKDVATNVAKHAHEQVAADEQTTLAFFN
jgi:hypothetical protein